MFPTIQFGEDEWKHNTKSFSSDVFAILGQHIKCHTHSCPLSLPMSHSSGRVYLILGSELISMRSRACRYLLGEASLADRCICVTPIEAEIASILYALNYAKLTQHRDLVMQKSWHLLCVGAKIDRKTIKCIKLNSGSWCCERQYWWI